MNKEELIQFLSNFEINENTIADSLNNKQIHTINQNVFISDNKFEKNQIFGDILLFIKLKKLLPSKYLLKFIQTHTKTINIKSEKRALDFTYGKNLSFDSIIKEQILINQKYYIISYKDNILGYAQIDKKQKAPIINIMNIGEYLKES